MPSSERHRKKTKEDTWGTEELSKSLKDAMTEESAHKQRSHEKEKYRDKERTDKEHKGEREHRDRDKDKDRHKKRERCKTDDGSALIEQHGKTGERRMEARGRDDNQGRSHRERKAMDRRHADEINLENNRREDGKSTRNREKQRVDKEKRLHNSDGERRHREKRERRSHDQERDGEERQREDRAGKRYHDKERNDRDKRREREKHRQGRRKNEGEGNKDKHRKEDDDGRLNRKDWEQRKHEIEKQEDLQSSGTHGSSYKKTDEYAKDDMHIEDNDDNQDDKYQDEGYSYEDDFEDYEDDFEDEDSGEDEEDEDDNVMTRESSAELEAVRKAMATENQAMHSGRKDNETSSSANSSRSATAKSSHSFVNFVAAKQRQINSQVWQHSQKRGKELMKLIELDVVAYDLFDMAPVREYELYIKSFGRSNTKQAFVQYNEDNLERDVQTDPIENREMWTQHPAEGVAAFGGAEKKGDEDEAVNETDSSRLAKFLQKAGQAISILLQEESGENTQGILQSNQRSIVFSEGYTELNSQLTILEGRHVTHAQFHPVQTNLLLTVHSTPKKGGETALLQRGLLCVWNVNEPSRPQKVLSCQSVPICCCFSPTKSTLAFAGTIDGSLVVWDLREPSSMHMSQILDGLEWTLRLPTFSTDGIQSQENHHSAVVTVQPIVAIEESLQASMQMQDNHITDHMEGLSFQLASLEEKGVIHFSVVIEIDKPDLAGSESDLGLVPCGKIKLIKTSSVSLCMSPLRGIGGDMKTFHMQLSPLDPNQFFVATDSGHILHGARHGGKVVPRMYNDDLEVSLDVVQIDFSPFGLPIFLVACGDGSIRLYSTTYDLPIITWRNSTNGVGIKCIQWSRSRPSVFYVMDEASKVYVWELLENDGAPVKIEQFTHARLTFMALSSDHLTAGGRGQPGKRQQMLITDVKGKMDVQRINQAFSTASHNELADMTDLLNNII